MVRGCAPGGKQSNYQTAGAVTLKTGGKKGNHCIRKDATLVGLTYEYLARRLK